MPWNSESRILLWKSLLPGFTQAPWTPVPDPGSHFFGMPFLCFDLKQAFNCFVDLWRVLAIQQMFSLVQSKLFSVNTKYKSQHKFTFKKCSFKSTSAQLRQKLTSANLKLHSFIFDISYTTSCTAPTFYQCFKVLQIFR